MSFFSAAPPTIAVEIARQRVSVASVEVRDRSLSLASHASEHLLPGAVIPSMNTSNIADPRGVADALKRAFERAGLKPRRVALAIPDSVAKVSLLHFEKVPERQSDLDELVSWQVRKSAPFPVEEAQITYVPGVKAADGSTEFVVVVARRDIIREYETACEHAGVQAGIVDLTTFNVINAVLSSKNAPSEDWLLVHVTAEDATMAILRGQHLAFFRNRGADGEAGLADMVHQTAMYYEDRLSGGGFRRVVLAGSGSPTARGQDTEYLRRALEQRLNTRVDPMLDSAAPLVGLIAREQAA